MILDINIKIADNDGNLLHHLEKRIDKLDYTSENLDINTDADKSFEDFLSEYLSNSGRVIRERLIYNLRTPLADKLITQSSETQKVDNLIEENQLKEQDVEYRISIGSKNVFIGKFPFRYLSDVKNPEGDLISCNTDNHKDNLTPYDTDDYKSNLVPYDTDNHKSNLVSYDRDDFQEEWDIFSTMTRAIEKYEENFYLINTEEVPYIIATGLDA